MSKAHPADALDVALVELARAAEEVGDAAQLLEREAFDERLRAVARDRPPDDLRALAHQRRGLDEHPPAVAGVAEAARVALGLEPVDDRGDRGGGEAAELGEAPRRDAPALVVDDVQALRVGAVEAQRLVGEAVASR